MKSKKASSQAAWALLTEGVTQARVESHRLQQLVERATSLVETSEERDHLYQVAGDLIMGFPQRLDRLILALDRTSLALSRMGQEFLESRLPLADKSMVDEAVQAAFGAAQHRQSSDVVKRIARLYLKGKVRAED